MVTARELRVSVEVCFMCIVDVLHVCACFAVTADVGWCGVYVFAVIVKVCMYVMPFIVFSFVGSRTRRNRGL